MPCRGSFTFSVSRAFLHCFWMSRLLAGASTQGRQWAGNVAGAFVGSIPGATCWIHGVARARYFSGTALKPFLLTR